MVEVGTISSVLAEAGTIWLKLVHWLKSVFVCFSVPLQIPATPVHTLVLHGDKGKGPYTAPVQNGKRLKMQQPSSVPQSQLIMVAAEATTLLQAAGEEGGRGGEGRGGEGGGREGKKRRKEGKKRRKRGERK